MTILQLPQAIFTSICSDWLIYKDLACLDTACSSKRLRDIYLRWICNARGPCLSNIRHFECYRIFKESNVNVHFRMFEMVEWLRCRFRDQEGGRLPMVIFYMYDSSDLKHFRDCHAKWLSSGKEHFSNVLAMTLVVRAAPFSRLLPMALELFPSIQTLELQFEDDETAFLEALIHHRAKLENVQFINFINGLCMYDERRLRSVGSRFLQLLGRKLTEVTNIDLLRDSEYCRHFTHLGSRFKHPISQPDTAWPIVSQFSQLAAFDYNMFCLRPGSNHFQFIPPSVPDICSSFKYITLVEFSSIQSSLSYVVDLLHLGNTVTCIMHPILTWQLFTDCDFFPNIADELPKPFSRIANNELVPPEEFHLFREFLSLIPQPAVVEVSVKLLSCTDAEFQLYVNDVLLQYAGGIISLKVSLDALLSAEAMILQSFKTFSSLRSLSIVPGLSSHFYGVLKSHLQNFVSGLPKLRTLRLVSLDELQDGEMQVLLSGLPSLDSLCLEKMHGVTKHTLHYLSHVSRVWRLLSFKLCSRVSFRDIRHTINAEGLLVLKVTHVASDSGFQVLGYGRVPIPATIR